MLEIGTACLKNYLDLAGKWFNLDLSKYNFFLMPISFFHGFEAAEPASRNIYSQEVQRLLAYLDFLEAGDENRSVQGQHVALRIETKLRRSRDQSAIAFRTANDPNAPVVNLKEEDIREAYPLTYGELGALLRERYSDFKNDKKFHNLKRQLVGDSRYAFVRLLDPNNPKSSRKQFFNHNIISEFDKHYARKTGTPASPNGHSSSGPSSTAQVVPMTVAPAE